MTRRRLRKEIGNNRDALFRLAYSWCHDRPLAEDLTQMSICKALERAHQLRSAESLKPWLFRILARHFADYCRTRGPDCCSADVSSSDYDPEYLLGRANRVYRVRAAIASLPPAQRHVLTLVEVGGMTYREVADVLDIPAGTVMSRLSRARRRLRAILLAQDGEAASKKIVPLKTAARE